MSCCRTWIPQTSPAIATTTSCRSSKTTEAIQTRKNFSDCLQFPWEPRAVVQYLINTKMHSLSLLRLVQFSFASADWLNEVKNKFLLQVAQPWRYLRTVQLYSVNFFLCHTQVFVCTLGTCCSIFYSCFISFYEVKRNSLYKTEK